MSTHPRRFVSLRRTFFFAGLIFLAVAFLAKAQTVTGTIQRTVTDTDERALPGVLALSKGFPMPWGHELIPQTDMANVNFGRITATLNTPRTIQAGLRYVF